MSDIKIEKGIEIPPKGSVGSKFPVQEMEVGDSFFCSFDVSSANSVMACLSKYGKDTGKKFTTRKVEGGTRAWRIE
jgi:hypothetical protein